MFFLLFELLNYYQNTKNSENWKNHLVSQKILEDNTQSLCPQKNSSSIELEQNKGFDNGNNDEAASNLYACRKTLKRINGHLCLLHIYNCKFIDLNDKSERGGGAIYMFTNSDKFGSKNQKYLNIEYCSFQNCKSLQGGAISIFTQQNSRCFVILNCTFTNNEAIENGNGGAILFKATKGQIENCKFYDNVAKLGGDIYYLFSAASLNEVKSDDYLTLKNNEFKRTNNDDEVTDSAIYLDWKPYSKIDFIGNKAETTKNVLLFGYNGVLKEENITLSSNYISPSLQSIIRSDCEIYNHFTKGFTGENISDEPKKDSESTDTNEKDPILTDTNEKDPIITDTNEKDPIITDTKEKEPVLTDSSLSTESESLNVLPEISVVSNTVSSENREVQLEGAPNNKKREKKIWLIVGIILAVVVIVIIILVIIIIKKRNNNNSNNQNLQDIDNEENETNSANSLGERIPTVECMNMLYNSDDHKNVSEAFDCSESINENTEINNENEVNERPQTDEHPVNNEKKNEYVFDPNDISEIWV